MRIDALKRVLVGAPMPLSQARHERLGKAVALAVFASDPLSSVAYATEEILLVLILADSAAPIYFFVVCILGMVGYGLIGAAFGLLPEAHYEPHPPGLEGIGLFLLLRAYSAGCTALTGVEAVSNGVQALKAPEGRNAQAVL